MEKEVEEAQVKENLVCALKKYISEKNKVIENTLAKTDYLSRKDKFKKRFYQKTKHQPISKNRFYLLTMREILGKFSAPSNDSFAVMNRFKHLKILWGHSFES